MSNTIYLITEDESDSKIVKEILKKRGFSIRVEWITTPGNKPGGLSRLLASLVPLIKTALAKKDPTDCVAVLHDADENMDTTKPPYRERIGDICKQYKVKQIIARDEIESWVLADSGVCKKLEINPKSWDAKPRPSDDLKTILNDKKRMRWGDRDRLQVIQWMNGDGDKCSDSMKKALVHLKDAPCIKP